MKSNTFTQMVLVGTMLIGGSAAQASDKSHGNQADWTTTLNVKLVLLEKLGADSLHVDVDTLAGDLTLKGTVDKRETKELAETLAKSVASVKSVKNDILLQASEANPNKAGVAVGEAEAEVKDAVLSTKIRLALVEKMGTDGFEVGTAAANGVVTLEFNHDFTAALRKQATQVVKGVAGVTKVVSVDRAQA